MRLVIALLVAASLTAPVCAAEAYVLEQESEILAVSSLEEGLDSQTREALSGLSPKKPADFGTAFLRIIRWASMLTPGSLRRAVRTSALLLLICLLCSMAGASVRSGQLHAPKLFGAFALTAACVTDLNVMTGLATGTLERLEEFSKLLLPVMCSAALASGAATSSGAVYLASSLFFSVLASLIRAVLIPLVSVFLALSAAVCATGDGRFTRLQSLAGWAVTVLLKGITYVFTGYVSLTGLAAGSADQAAVRAAKSAISAAVPVVGRIVSDASESVLAGAQFLRAAAGSFGCLAILAISLVPFFQIGVQYLAMKLTTALAGLCAEEPYVKLLSSVTTAMGFYLGMVACCCLMLLLSCVCFMRVVSAV